MTQGLQITFPTTGNEFGDIYTPEGWRNLEVGETVKEGDFVLGADQTEWRSVYSTIGNKVKTHTTFIRSELTESPVDQLFPTGRPAPLKAYKEPARGPQYEQWGEFQ